MRKLLVAALFLVSCSKSIIKELNSSNTSNGYFSKAMGLIKNDERLASYDGGKNETTIPLRLEQSSEIIRFDLPSLIEDVIKQDYIKTYSMFNKLTIQEQKIENTITDSLAILDKSLNTLCTNRKKSDLPLKSDQKSHFIIYFSNQCNNLLYAEAVPFDICIDEDKSYDATSYSRVFTYLFVLNNTGKITKFYKGEMHHN